MSLTCLKDYIGILGCGSATPLSSLYINSLPGINLESIDKIANSEQLTYLGVWSDVQDRALQKLSLDVALRFQQRYRIKNISRSLDLGRIIDNTNQSAEAAHFRGFSVEIKYFNQFNIVTSNFQNISVQSLSLYLPALEGDETYSAINLKLFDMETANVLDTFTISTPVAGWNSINVNKIYVAQRLFIGYDSTTVQSVYQYADPNVNNIFNMALYDLYGSGIANGYIRGAELDTLTPGVVDLNGLVYGINSFGLSGIFSLICSYDTFICNNMQSLTYPLSYLLGAEMMIERLFSPRLNRWTTTDKKTANDLLAYYQAEYANNLNQLIDGIDLDTTDFCLECNAPVSVIESSL